MTTLPSTREASPYYPPRARWYSFLFRRVDRLWWRLSLDPGPAWEESIPKAAADFLVPGMAFYLRGPRWLGKAALSACAVLLAIFVVCLGRPAAGWAAAALLSVHASGMLHRQHRLIGKSLPYRMCASVAVTLILLFCLYLPARSMVERYVAVPLLLNGQPVIVRGAWLKRPVRTRDWVAYQLASNGAYISGASLWSPALDIGQIVASPGDRVEFSGDTLTINGRVQPPIPQLFANRTLIVPAQQWLVRPNVGASMNHQQMQVGERQAGMLLYNDLVTEERVVGVPFQTWCGRRQILP